MEGFLGAWISLSLFTYPYVFLVATVALRRIDPSLEEAARGLGASSRKGIPNHHPAPAEARGRGLHPPGGPLHDLRLRRRLAHALRHADAGHLHPVGGPSRSSSCAHPGASADPSRRGGALGRTPESGQSRVLHAATDSPEPPLPPHQPWSAYVTYGFLGTTVSLALLIPVGVLAFWLRPRARLGRTHRCNGRLPAVRSLAVSSGRCRRSRIGRHPDRRPGGPIPEPLVDSSRTQRLGRVRPPSHHRRCGGALFHRHLPESALPITRRPHRRVCRHLPPPGHRGGPGCPAAGQSTRRGGQPQPGSHLSRARCWQSRSR